MNWKRVIEALRHGADAKNVIMEGIYKSGLSTEGVGALATQVGLLRCIADALELGLHEETCVDCAAGNPCSYLEDGPMDTPRYKQVPLGEHAPGLGGAQ